MPLYAQILLSPNGPFQIEVDAEQAEHGRANGIEILDAPSDLPDRSTDEPWQTYNREEKQRRLENRRRAPSVPACPHRSEAEIRSFLADVWARVS